MSFAQSIYHIVFATKNREKIIAPEYEREVYTLLLHILNKNNCHVYRIGGMPDHIHILTDIPAIHAVANIVQSLKRESSTIITQKRIIPHWHGWQEGYGCFSYSIKDVPTIRNYIINQKEHHRNKPFIEELREWLIQNGVSPDAPFFPK